MIYIGHLWLILAILGYAIISALILIGREWEERKQRELVKIITCYLAGLLVGFLEWCFYESTFMGRELDPIVILLVLLLETGLIIFTWFLMMRIWG